MVAGAALAGLVKVGAMLVGMVAIWRTNRTRRRGDTVPEDDDLARRKAAQAETERRMASYLAQRNSAYRTTDNEVTEQEIRR